MFKKNFIPITPMVAALSAVIGQLPFSRAYTKGIFTVKKTASLLMITKLFPNLGCMPTYSSAKEHACNG